MEDDRLKGGVFLFWGDMHGCLSMETMYKLQMSSKCSSTCVYSLGVAPSQDASDHQEYHIFRSGDPNLNLHLPLESWEGATPNVFF